MSILTSHAFLDRLKRCDHCGRRAVDPILYLVDYDETRLICEAHATKQQTALTPSAAIAQARSLIALPPARSDRKRAA